MCELARSVGSDVDSGSSVDDWRHKIWNPLLDITGPAFAEIPARRRGGTCGNHEPFRFGRDDTRRGGKERCDLRSYSVGANQRVSRIIGKYLTWGGSRMVAVGRIRVCMLWLDCMVGAKSPSARL